MRTPRPLPVSLGALTLSVIAAVAVVAPGTVANAAPAPATSKTVALELKWYDLTDQSVRYAADATKVPTSDPHTLNEPATASRVWAVSWLAAARAVKVSSDPVFQGAAFAAALHDTLVDQIPSRRDVLDAGLDSTLAELPAGGQKSAGLAVGRTQASVALAQRRNDGLDRASIDIPWAIPPAAPGIYQPTVSDPTTTPPTVATTVIRAGQGKARPFLLQRNDQFRPAAPPSLTSRRYLDSLAEVRAYGAVDSTVRTPAQTDVAKFWIPATNVVYYQLLRGILVNTSSPLTTATRLVAAFHVATTDAQIAIYQAKYTYSRWRPETAIHTGVVDPDPSWQPAFPPPAHPEYPSGHTGYAGAAQAVLTAFLGPNVPGKIDVSSTTDPGVTHSWRTFGAITDEVVDARVWEGIHFRFSDETGTDVGRSVGAWSLANLRTLGL